MSQNLSDVKDLWGDDRYQDFISHQAVGSFREFIQYLYKEMDRAISNVEENKHYLFRSGEDLITAFIVTFLKGCKIMAEHDSNSNGNPDIKVEWYDYTWLAEAKIVNSNYEAMEGWRQLVNRYSSGSPKQRTGGVLLYLLDGKTTETMKSWREYLSDAENVELHIEECRLNQLCFFSQHENEVSGLYHCIRHMPVNLTFKPTDKSARSSKKHNAN